MKDLDPKKVKEEFNLRARRRDGISKVLSNRFSSNINEKFDSDVKELLNKNFRDERFRNVLEVGVGIGRIAPFFVDRCEKFYGVDFSEGMLDEASKNLLKYKNIELIYGNASELEFQKNFFDIGILSLVLKHNNNEQTLKIIKNMKKWCKRILLIEHVSGGSFGSNIAIIRDASWYIKRFSPKKVKLYHPFKRYEDNIIFCIFESTDKLTLFFIRHGHVDTENQFSILGQKYDKDLSIRGKKQVKSLKRLIENAKPNIIYTSCLRRATQTAREISGKIPTIRDKRLNEMDFGFYSGKDVRNYPEIFISKYKSTLGEKEAFPEGESIRDLKKRIASFHKDIIKTKKPVICIVSHQWVINNYLKFLFKTKKDFIFNHGSLIKVDLEGGKVGSFKKLNEETHN